MRTLICLLIAFASIVISQSDVDYYINCPGEKRNMDTFDEAVARAKEEQFDHTHFYICGIVNITSSQDITFRVKMFGFIQEGKQKQRQVKRLPSLNTTSVGEDEWQHEANERRRKMWNMVDGVDVGLKAELWVDPGVRFDFHGLTQIHYLKIVMAEGKTGGFRINFMRETGIHKSIIGGSLYQTPLDVISSGYEFKCYDSIIGVSKFEIRDDLTIFSRCAWFLAPGNGRNAFTLVEQESVEISNSFFAGKDTAGHNAEVVISNPTTLKMKYNNWFDSSIRFEGPVPKIDSTSEFGYSFGAPPAQ